MKQLTATDAARRFSEVLDDVERARESYVVMRRGRPVATIGPAPATSGSRLKQLLAHHQRDASWAHELGELRGLLTPPADPWNG